MELRGLILVSLCIGACFAAPTASRNQCDKFCLVSSGYEEGKTYLYDYESVSSLFMQGENGGRSEVSFSCTAAVESLGPCELVLSLSNVQLFELDPNEAKIVSPNAEEFRTLLEQDKLRFSMQDGRITGVCNDNEEIPWVLNAQKGILSAFQVTKPSETDEEQTETDVTGTCRVKVTQDGDTYTKTKDLSRCSDRFNMAAHIQVIRLLPNAPTMTMVDSTHSCTHMVESNRLASAECTEQHMLKPYSKDNQGPTASVTQTLTYVETRDSVTSSLDDSFDVISNLLYDHAHHDMEPRTDNSVGQEIIQNICRSMENGVDGDTAHLFTALVYEFGKLDSTLISRLLDYARRNCEEHTEAMTKIVGSALFQCQTTGCVQVVLGLIHQGVIEDKTVVNSYMSTLAVLANPTSEMIGAVFEFTEAHKTDNMPFVALSSMTNRFCAINEECLTREVVEVVEFFKNNLGARCRFRDAEEKRLIMIALRAIANAGIPTSTLNSYLKKCFTNPTAINSIQVAALQAYAAVPCNYQERHQLLAVFGSKAIDSEMRLIAYKGLMKCPTEDVLTAISAVVEDEETNQVVSYVVSHLKNVRESQDPLKQTLKELVLNNEAISTFLDDPLKFSRNFEFSFYNDTTGLGFTGESDIIFSSQSFMPRQVSASAQFDVFGFAIEAFEFGGRAEGVQKTLEDKFAPWAKKATDFVLPVPDDIDEEDISEENEANPRPGRGQSNNRGKNTNGRPRNKRHLVKEGKLKNVVNNYEVEVEDEPEGYLYMKVFGKDVWYFDVNDIKAEMEKKMAKSNGVQTLIELAQGKTYEDTQSYLFGNYILTLPLSNGLPLRLSGNSSSIVHQKASGKVDIFGVSQKPSNLEISGTIEPSFAAESSSLFEVDAHCARAGLNHVLKTQSALKIGGKIIIENGRRVHVQLDAIDDLELTSFSTKILYLHQETMNEMQTRTNDAVLNLDEECTGDFLQNLMGIRLCGETRYHSSADKTSYPMGGSYESKIFVQKMEDDLTTYDIDVSFSSDSEMVGREEQVTKRVHMMVGTPNTAVERTYEITASLNKNSKEFNMELDTPYKDVTVSASASANRGSFSVNVDDEEYSFNYDYAKTEMDSEVGYYPNFDLVLPHLGELHYSGSVIHNLDDEHVSIDMQLDKQTGTLLTSSGSITKVSKKKKVPTATLR